MNQTLYALVKLYESGFGAKAIAGNKEFNA
jgi:hypothetical protein